MKITVQVEMDDGKKVEIHKLISLNVIRLFLTPKILFRWKVDECAMEIWREIEKLI